MNIERGDTIRLNSDADVSLSYKDGPPPKKYIQFSDWIVDDYEDTVNGRILNLSTAYPEGGTNAGSYCCFVHEDDVKEIVKTKKERNLIMKNRIGSKNVNEVAADFGKLYSDEELNAHMNSWYEKMKEKYPKLDIRYEEKQFNKMPKFRKKFYKNLEDYFEKISNIKTEEIKQIQYLKSIIKEIILEVKNENR